MPLSQNLGTLTSWNPLGHSRPVTGLLYLLPFRTSFESDPRSGRPSTSRNEEMIAKVKILKVSYTTSTFPTGKQLTRNSTWRSCDVCVNQFAENDRKIGGMATGSCTTTMCPHTIHILCSSFWPNTVPLSCSGRHIHQTSHNVNFSYSQGLRTF